MSLFDGTGTDIWSMGAFPEESSLKDLLDSGVFTLEQLLCEDELLQDLKGLHPQLIAYLSKPQICRELVAYLTCTSDQNILFEEDDLNIKIRFPYIACEIICCEIATIVDTLADGYIDDDNTSIFDESSTAAQENASIASNDDSKDATGSIENEDVVTELKLGRTRLLDALFDLSLISIKDQSDEDITEDVDFVVDDRLAGYLEKVLCVLFKLRPITLATYLNENGNKLLPLFFRHISSYSIAQILQHLLLPMNKSEESLNGNDETPSALLDPSVNAWMNNDQTLTLLLQKIVSPTQPETLKSFDEVTHSTDILIALLQSSRSPLERLLESSIFSKILLSLTEIPDPYKPNECRLTHVLHILEAILLQLGGYGMHSRASKEMKLSILPYVPQIIKALKEILTHPSTKSWKMKCQLKKEISQCGVPRLRGVRVLEALVLLGEEEIDDILVSEENGGGDLLKVVCNLFWEMEWCSGLHQSVANMIVHVLEGRNKRYFIQNYLINEYNLLEKLLDAFERNTETVKKQNIRLGYMGHVIIMCQALDHIENSTHKSATDSSGETNQENPCLEEQNDSTISEEIEDEDLQSIEKGIRELDVPDKDETDDELPTQSNSNETNVSNSKTNKEGSNEKVGGSQDDIDINSFTVIGQAMSTPLPPGEGSDEIDNNSEIDPITSNDFSRQTINAESTHPSSKLINYLQSHSTYDKWSYFLNSTLSEISIMQSSPLGGSSVDQLGNYGDIDETDHDILGSGVGGTSLDISENELDIAASMMEALSNGGSAIDSFSSDRAKNGSGHTDYLYDDPLGRRPGDDDFGNDEDKKGERSQDDVDDDDINGGSDVQVFDLFVPNFPGNAFDVENIDNDEEESDSNSDDDDENVHEVGKELSKDPLDASWANFGEFESVSVEKNASDDRKAPVPHPATQEDFFANFGDVSSNKTNEPDTSNVTGEYFFDADFSGFPSGSGKVQNNDSGTNEDTVKKKDATTPPKNAPLENEGNEFKVENIFSENGVSILSEELTGKQEEEDPFGDFHKRRPSIDELF